MTFDFAPIPNINSPKKPLLSQSDIMGFNRKVINPGNCTDIPNMGDTVRLEYTGYLYDGSKGANDYRGVQYVVRIALTHKVDC